MATIILLVETVVVSEGGPDPTLVDAQTIAKFMVDSHNYSCEDVGEPMEQVRLISADWQNQ